MGVNEKPADGLSQGEEVKNPIATNATAEDVETGVVKQENTYAYDDSRKLGITGAVFLILNKMIGTGIFSTPSSIFAATGSVGIILMLWVIGMTAIPRLSPLPLSLTTLCPSLRSMLLTWRRWLSHLLRPQRLARVRPGHSPLGR